MTDPSPAATGSGYHFRSFTPEVHVRTGAGQDGRTIYGIAVPYRAPVRINRELVEQFEPGAFNHQLRSANRVRYAREHIALGGELIGAVRELRDDAAGLYFEARVARTTMGDDTLELVREGALPEVSIHFKERQNRVLQGGITARVKADLVEIASVLQGAYGRGAVVAGVRSLGANIADAEAIPLDGPDVATLDLRARADEIIHGGMPDLPDYELQIKRLTLGL